MNPAFLLATVLASLVSGACGFRLNGSGSGGDGGPGDDAVDTMPDMAIDARADWWDPAWRNRRPITIDGTKLLAALDDFPVLVRIPALDAGTVQPTGADLRFVSTDNMFEFSHELDTFVIDGTSYAWVRMTLPQAATTLWLYHGNPTATSTSSGAAVFGASFVSVHHLGDLADATGKGHTASAPAAQLPVPVATGAVGGAYDFDGGDDRLELAGSEADFDVITMMTITAWVRPAQFTEDYQSIVAKGGTAWRLQRADDTEASGFGTTSGSSHQNLNGSTDILDGNWHHVAGVLYGTTKRLFVDGNGDETVSYSSQLDNNQRAVWFGANAEASGNPRHWDGDLDEIRFTLTPRSAEWLAAEYLTVADETFVMIGPDEPY